MRVHPTSVFPCHRPEILGSALCTIPAILHSTSSLENGLIIIYWMDISENSITGRCSVTAVLSTDYQQIIKIPMFIISNRWYKYRKKTDFKSLVDRKSFNAFTGRPIVICLSFASRCNKQNNIVDKWIINYCNALSCNPDYIKSPLREILMSNFIYF